MKNIVNDILFDEKIWNDLDSLEHIIDEIDLNDKTLEDLDIDKKVEVEDIMFTRNLINELEGKEKKDIKVDKTFFREDFKINEKLKKELEKEKNLDAKNEKKKNVIEEVKDKKQESKNIKVSEKLNNNDSLKKVQIKEDELLKILLPLDKKIREIESEVFDEGILKKNDEEQSKEVVTPVYDLRKEFKSVEVKSKKMMPLIKSTSLEENIKEYHEIFSKVYETKDLDVLEQEICNYWVSIIENQNDKLKLQKLLVKDFDGSGISDEKLVELVDENNKLKYLVKLLETKLKKHN